MSEPSASPQKGSHVYEPVPLRTPYPPDLADDAVPLTAFGDLLDAVVEDADWANELGLRTSACRVSVRRSRFTGSELGESTLVDVTFADCRLDLVGLRNARLERVVFADCRMTECDLAGARLVDVSFERCELRGAVLSGVSLERVSFRGCDLLGVRGPEGLRGARMGWDDMIANAPTLAAGLGLEIVD